MKMQFGWIVTFLFFSHCSNEQPSAYQFVYNLYSNYGKSEIDFSSLDSKFMDTIFSPDFLNVMKLREKKDQEGLGYDPVCDCQDDRGFKLEIIDVNIQNGSTYAKVKFKIQETKFTETLKLVKQNKKWLIADIINSRGSLYDLLAKNLFEN